MVQCICLDDSGKPKQIPVHRWPKKEQMYHIVHVSYHPNQGIQGVLLKEISLDENCTPYEAYKLSRFGVTQEGLIQLIQLMKDCTELNDIDIMQFIEESELQTVEI